MTHRNRAEAALLDSMVVRVTIPAAVAQSCALVSSNPLLSLGKNAPSGAGALSIQLQSDFQVFLLYSFLYSFFFVASAFLSALSGSPHVAPAGAYLGTM